MSVLAFPNVNRKLGRRGLTWGSLLTLVVGFVMLQFDANRGCAEERLSATPSSTQTTFFSDDDVAYAVNFSAEQLVVGVVSWKLTTLHRTLGRGELNVNVDADKDQAATLNWRMPHIKDGVIEKTVLLVSRKVDDDDDTAELLQRDLWVFPREPFTDRKEWLEQLDLQLYDPIGDTTEVFDEAKIPFHELRTLAALSASEDGLVIVGEGISLRKDSGLSEALFELAAKGRNVLWFGPEDGDFVLPGVGENSGRKRPDNLRLTGSDMVEDLDKRLDANAWAAKPPAANARADAARNNSVALQLVADRGRTNVEFVAAERGWTWMEAEFIDPNGKLIICGLRLARVWDTSPTPRFMLARILEYLDDSKPKTDLPDERE